jgi:hypothetical protein
MKVNGKEIRWEDPPKGEFFTDVKAHVLWQDKKTGANLTILKAPKSEKNVMAPHAHPNANEWAMYLAGEFETADGTRITISPDNNIFAFSPKAKPMPRKAGKSSERQRGYATTMGHLLESSNDAQHLRQGPWKRSLEAPRSRSSNPFTLFSITVD